jgi:hypothetical protein
MLFMLIVVYAECHKLALYAECPYAECSYAECLGVTCQDQSLYQFFFLKQKLFLGKKRGWLIPQYRHSHSPPTKKQFVPKNSIKKLKKMTFPIFSMTNGKCFSAACLNINQIY